METKQFKRATPYKIILVLFLFTAILTYIIPISTRDLNTLSIAYGIGRSPIGLWDLLWAPINGFYNAVPVILAIVLCSIFFSLITGVKALEELIVHLTRKVNGPILVAGVMLPFAIMSSAYGMWEEIIAFALIVMPIFLKAGYSKMTGIGAIFLSVAAGEMGAIVDPYSTGAAVAAIGDPNFSIGTGFLLRLTIFVVTFVVAYIMIVQYGSANRDLTKVNTDDDQDSHIILPRHMASSIVLIAIVSFLIMGFMPWEGMGGETLRDTINAPIIYLGNIPAISTVLGAENIPYFGDWGFDEFNIMFLIGIFLLLAINKIGAEDFIDMILKGFNGVTGIIIMLSFARAISEIMGNSQSGISVTLVYWISSLIQGVPLWVFPILIVLVYVVMAGLITSTSSISAISMPILGTVTTVIFAGATVGITGGYSILVSAFEVGFSLTCIAYPNPITMGVCESFEVPFLAFTRFIVPRLLVMMAISTAILSFACYVPLM